MTLVVERDVKTTNKQINHHGVTFDFHSTKVCLPAIFEICFSCDKDIWITATDYFMYFYIIVLFPLTAILQLINFTAS